MKFNRGRYSKYLRPFLVLFDLGVINLFTFYLLDFNFSNLYFFSIDFFNNKNLLFFVYSTLLWLISTYLLKFYRVYRFTSVLNILTTLVKQLIAFIFIIYTFIGLFRSINLDAILVLKYIFICFSVIGLMKILTYYSLKKIRTILNGNIRDIIIIGESKGALKLNQLVTTKKDLGYNLLAKFSNSGSNGFGTIEQSFSFLKNNSIDEIYCSIDELSENQINEYVKAASINRINIKFIPETGKLFTKRLYTEYYNYLPILSIREVSLNNDINVLLKRAFDIIFSIFVIVFILSWLTPIMYVLIKLESKGPLFYKHQRNGLNYKTFICYKFRTLKLNTEEKNEYVKKEDLRVTKIGKFIRKTSMDELPQFYNVLFGEMSIVGPRPHMLSYTKKYAKIIDKYSFIYRHSVKPGLTGLAQVKGYRGEIKFKKDIINRIKYDIFYIENWSMLLDIKIIIQTIINIVRGEEKAY